METPSSIPSAAVPSQATAHTSGKKQQEVPEIKSMSSEPRTTTRMGGRRPERPVLLDITNDSPIVGLAAGSLKTPSSSVGKSRARAAGRGGGTPGSGEALLRGQVKTLLQKVDEDAELVRVLSDKAPFQALLGHLRSPAGLLAPTPANTPQVVSDGPVAEILPPAQKDDGDSKVSTLVAEVLKEQETPDLRQCVINRALQFDSAAEDSDQFSGSPTSFSAVTYQGSDLSGCTKKPMDDEDCSSAWSTQTNPSWREEEEEEEEEVEVVVVDCGGADDGYLEGEEEEEAEAEGVDALCEGMRMMSVDQRAVPDFAGKHTRFTYDSEDEMVGEEEVGGGGISPGVLRLWGMPVPNGKHLRFQEEEENARRGLKKRDFVLHLSSVGKPLLPEKSDPS